MILSQPSPQEAADIVAISQLAVSYSEAICRGQIDEAVLVYADDGVLRSPTSQDVIGRQAIADLIRSTTADLEFVFQSTHLGLVRVEGDRAWARFPLTEWGRRSDGTGVQFLGFYDDEVRRTPEGWRFASRYLTPRTMGRPTSFGGRVHDPSLHTNLTG